MIDKKSDQKYSEEKTAQRRDAALLRALKAPPKPHEDMKLGKGKKKPTAKQKPAK